MSQLAAYFAAIESEEPLPPVAPLHMQWVPAFKLAYAWERCATELAIMGDWTTCERYRQHAADIYVMLGDKCGEDWALPAAQQPAAAPAGQAAEVAA